MKKEVFALWLTALASAACAGEGDPPTAINGSLYALAWASDPKILGRDEGMAARTQLDLRAHAERLSGLVRIDASSSRQVADSSGRNKIREAWIRYRGTSSDLTLGRQMMPVGRTDVLVLQNQFAPRDLTQITMTEAEQQLGVTAARLDVYPNDDLTLSGALIRQDRSNVLPRSFDPSLRGATLADKPSPAALLRAEYRKGMFELALGASTGVDPYPGLLLASGGTTIVYPKETRFSFDGAATIGGDVFRWDMVTASDETAQMPGFSHHHVALALGWDRGLWQDANLSLQMIVRRDRLEQPPAAQSVLLQPIFDANSRLSQAYGRSQRYLTATLKQRLRTELQFESSALLGNDRQWAFVQRFTWQWREGYSLQAKAQYVHGNSNVLMGNLGFKSQLYLAAVYQF